MKKIVLCLLILTLISVGIFAYGEAQEGAAGSTSIKATMGTKWGYDFNTEASGFEEIVDFDLAVAWMGQAFHNTEVTDPMALHGAVYSFGGNITLSLDDHYGDNQPVLADSEWPDYSYISNSGDHNPPIKIEANFENMYGRIEQGPLYLTLAMNYANFYTRQNGWNFLKSQTDVMANWAHIGYNVPWAGAVNQNAWAITGGSDQVNFTESGSGIGVGYVSGLTEMFFMISSPKSYIAPDWAPAEYNADNLYDIGLSMETSPVTGVVIDASLATGLNYDLIPLGFSTRATYVYELSDTMSLKPYIGFDLGFIGDAVEDDAFADNQMEIAGGVNISWPGSAGWGYSELQGEDQNVYSGLQIGASYASTSIDGIDPVLNLAITMKEDSKEGMVPGLGMEAAFEIANLTDSDLMETSYGYYIDYVVQDVYKPYVKMMYNTWDGSVLSGVIDGEMGFVTTFIPDAQITVKYANADWGNLLEADDLGTDKGQFTTEVTVSF